MPFMQHPCIIPDEYLCLLIQFSQYSGPLAKISIIWKESAILGVYLDEAKINITYCRIRSALRHYCNSRCGIRRS